MRYQKVYSQIWNDEKFTDLTHSQKLLFLYLLTSPHNNLIGLYVVKLGYIAADIDVNPKSLQKDLEKLSEKGLIKYDSQVGLIYIPNFLKHNPITNPNQILAAKKILKILPKSPLISIFLEGLPERLKKELIKGLPEGLLKPETEYRNQNTEINNISLSKERESKTKPPVEEFFNLWNETVKDTPIPQARELTPQRRDKIRVRLQERPLDQWKEIFKRITASRFCRGDNPRGWRASFDWIIANQENAVKVLEGKYDDTGIRDIRENSKFTPCGGIKGGKNKYDGVAITAGKDP